MPTDYSQINVTKEQSDEGEHKRHLGGGANAWAARGAFQLALLQEHGLRPQDRLLDIGCGPLRAGEHFIRYLDAGHYGGFDYNPSFVRIARETVETLGLQAKAPRIEVIENFAFETREPYDVGLAFSVLNHCTPEQQRLFFENIPASFRPGARIFVTHASWFDDEKVLDGTALRVERRILSSVHDPADYGWAEVCTVFPILELVRR